MWLRSIEVLARESGASKDQLVSTKSNRFCEPKKRDEKKNDPAKSDMAKNDETSYEETIADAA